MSSPLPSAVEWLATAAASRDPVWTFYDENLRTELFNGYLTRAGLVFAAKTFIVIKMKEEVYGTETYARRFREKKRITGESKLTRFGPLRNLSRALFRLTSWMTAAALLQVTVGLVPNNVVACVNIGVCVYAFWLLWGGLRILKENLDDWLTFVEEEADEASSANISPESTDDSDGDSAKG